MSNVIYFGCNSVIVSIEISHIQHLRFGSFYTWPITDFQRAQDFSAVFGLCDVSKIELKARNKYSTKITVSKKTKTNKLNVEHIQLVVASYARWLAGWPEHFRSAYFQPIFF